MLPAHPKARSSLANCLLPLAPRVDISLGIKDYENPGTPRMGKGQEMHPLSWVGDANLWFLISVLSQAPETL